MNRIVFCDFDGTITVEETFVAVLKKFSPQLSAILIPEIYAKRLTLREGVRQILESIPSKCYPEIIEFTRHQAIRPGFQEFLDFLDERKIPFVVVSGGLRGMVEAVLGDFAKRTMAIYAIDVDTNGSHLIVHSEFEGDTELMAKVQVIEKYIFSSGSLDTSLQAIAIGDSITDLNMGLYAHAVFARDRLCQYLDEYQKSYVHWNDFFDIKEYLINNS
jgi:2-hydroxy-3-keto-5-methylthiopentenyl-1-phosphate phosphatase